MSTLSATISEEHTQRYEALLRATNAIGTSSDCDAAAETIVGALREVIAFDYLELVVFESDSWTVTWHLLHSNGITQRLGLSEVAVNGTPIESVHASQHALVVANWNEEPRFREHGQLLEQTRYCSYVRVAAGEGPAAPRCDKHRHIACERLFRRRSSLSLHGCRPDCTGH